ncbi:MAG TPA: hypothetical protein VFB79_06215 [Candidatus Angelobacter sp.]|nr:hypothetical protein [Candidatus Angelobacter sp.]
MDTYLNVIFHGPFLFVVHPDKVEVLAPDIEKHEFGIGTWQQEMPCYPDIYTLNFPIPLQNGPLQIPNAPTYVSLDSKKFPDMNILETAAYQFVLPLPSSMMGLGLLTLSSTSIFTGPDTNNVETVPLQISSAHLFSYKIPYAIDTNNRPQLKGRVFSWEPELLEVGSNVAAANLHIFCESAFDLGESHPAHVFQQMMNEVLSGVSLSLVDPFPLILKFDPNPSAIGLGISDDEQGGLRGTPANITYKHIGSEQGLLVPPRICDAPSLVVITS